VAAPGSEGHDREARHSVSSELRSRDTARADAKRLEAITLLRRLLESNPTGDVKADGLFKLAELVWEEARRTYLIQMEDYARKLLESQESSGPPPKQPHIDLGPAEQLYIELHDSLPLVPIKRPIGP
jgi:hypothetical protein